MGGAAALRAMAAVQRLTEDSSAGTTPPCTPSDPSREYALGSVCMSRPDKTKSDKTSRRLYQSSQPVRLTVNSIIRLHCCKLLVPQASCWHTKARGSGMLQAGRQSLC